jgi:hypothetical protein
VYQSRVPVRQPCFRRYSPQRDSPAVYPLGFFFFRHASCLVYRRFLFSASLAARTLVVFSSATPCVCTLVFLRHVLCRRRPLLVFCTSCFTTRIILGLLTLPTQLSRERSKIVYCQNFTYIRLHSLLARWLCAAGSLVLNTHEFPHPADSPRSASPPIRGKSGPATPAIHYPLPASSRQTSLLVFASSAAPLAL